MWHTYTHTCMMINDDQCISSVLFSLFSCATFVISRWGSFSVHFIGQRLDGRLDLKGPVPGTSSDLYNLPTGFLSDLWWYLTTWNSHDPWFHQVLRENGFLLNQAGPLWCWFGIQYLPPESRWLKRFRNLKASWMLCGTVVTLNQFRKLNSKFGVHWLPLLEIFHCSFHAPRHVKEVMWSLLYECGRRDMCNDGLLLLWVWTCQDKPPISMGGNRNMPLRHGISPSALGISEVIIIYKYTYTYFDILWLYSISYIVIHAEYNACILVLLPPHHLILPTVKGKTTLLPQPGSSDRDAWCEVSVSKMYVSNGAQHLETTTYLGWFQSSIIVGLHF